MTPVTRDLLRRHPLPEPAAGSKDGRGAVLVIGGSRSVPGAAVLAATAALRAGAGRLRIATGQSLALPVGMAVPESMVIGLGESEAGGIAPDEAARLIEAAARMNAVLIGPGMIDPAETTALSGRLVPDIEASMVVDAGALACLPNLAERLRERAGRLVITPHAGEMARLLGVERDAVEADPAAAARKAVARLGCIVVMKGAKTHIAGPDGALHLFEGGTVGLATSGSGDVLAGIIAGLLARGAEPLWAAIWGVHLHGEAGTRLMRRHGGIGFLARELAAEIPKLMAEL